MQLLNETAAGALQPASAGSSGDASGDGFAGLAALLPEVVFRRLGPIPSELLVDGGPHCWGFLAFLGWLLWLLTQAPWRALRAVPGAARRDGVAAAAAAAWGGHGQLRRGALGGGAGPGLPSVLRTFGYGCASALLWLAFLEPDREFKSWEDVYFFCGEQYQHCTAGFRWDGSGWVQAFVLWNFVLSSALLLQKFVIALGLGGLLPGEEVVTRESFVSIAWRLVPYWMNQWEQQWGAECSSMLFELPHFALELLVVLPCVQILCGRLRVMAQPHIREPLPPAARRGGPAAAAAAEGPIGRLQAVGGAQGRAGAGEGPAAAMAAGEGAAAAEGAGGGADHNHNHHHPAAGAAEDAAGAAAGAGRAGCWVPDVMRCRWRCDPGQRRLLPRLRANLRAMAMLTLILAVAASNSLFVPLALERLPANSARADQILRFRRELSFLVTTGRHADTALWYHRVNAAAAAAAAAASREAGQGGSQGETPWAGNDSGGSDDGYGSGSGSGSNPEDDDDSLGFAHYASGEPSGPEGGVGFLAAALEGSSNSSRLDAKLAVWSTIWRPLLPAHWLRAVLAADTSQVAGLDAAYLSAMQYEETPQSAALAQQLHAAANNPAKAAAAAAALQQLLQHPEQAGSILPTASSSSGAASAGSKGSDEGGADGSDGAMVHLLLMASMAAGIDAKAAPLQLKATLVLSTAAEAETEAEAGAGPSRAAAGGSGNGSTVAELTRDLRWLRQQQALYAAKLVSPAEEGSGDGGNASSAGASSSPPALTWQQQQRMAPLYRLLHKHCAELERMRSADHHRLIPLVELSLAIMRLSCERFFSLLAVFLGFLLFRDPPPAAQRTIRVIAAFAAVFQRLVLYSFPAICWAYGAGALFSSFVSVVFWTGPVVRAVERLRNAATSVQPRQWRAATPAEVERMGGQCAICWGDMPAAGGTAPLPPAPAAHGLEPAPQQLAGAGGERDAAAAAAAAAVLAAPPAAPVAAGSGSNTGWGAMSLPCGHAYHRECLQQWLQQCYGQARAATCPMCQASIPLRVRYRMPWHQQPGQAAPEDGLAAEQQAAADGIPGLAALALQLQEDFRARFEPMLDVGAPPPEVAFAMDADVAAVAARGAGVPHLPAAALDAQQQQQQWPPPDAVLPPPPPPAPPAQVQAGAAAAAGVPPLPAAQLRRQERTDPNPPMAAPQAAGMPQQPPAPQEVVLLPGRQDPPLAGAVAGVAAGQQQQQGEGHMQQGQQQQGQAAQAPPDPDRQEARRQGLLGRLLRRRRPA